MLPPTLHTMFAISIKFSLEPLMHDLGLPLALMGIFIVFMALILVVTFISSLPRIMAVLERALPSAEHATSAAPTTSPQDSDDDVIAVIAAAVATVIDHPHRIIRTREITAREMAWAQQGRLQVQTSHKPQK